MMAACAASIRAPSEDVSVADAYGAPLGGPSDRPWVALCMVASIDGSTVFDGASGGLSNPTDIAVLLQLRSLAQVILVGAGTANTEGYGPPSGGQRVGVVTRAGSVDFDSDLFTSGAGFVVTAADSTFAVPDGVDVHAGRAPTPSISGRRSDVTSRSSPTATWSKSRGAFAQRRPPAGGPARRVERDDVRRAPWVGTALA